MTVADSALAQRRIRLLPSHVANAIAAGEVVERPASVVKELCENAIDAGASSITVTIEGGGLSRIAVVDNGGGISADEMPLAVARHATSKIASIDDLVSAQTLGFRGEALASIAAVSRMTVRSAQRDSRAGREITVSGSEILKDSPAPSVPGTTIEVRDLFFNTPARLKFLKAERSEVSRAVKVVSELALSKPQIRFECEVDGRRALQTTGGSLLAAITAVYGARDAEAMLPVDVDGEVHVSGVAGQPHRHRGQRNVMVLLVNGRRVHNRMLLVAVENAYRSLVPAGRFPICVLSLDLAPGDVDVNVHPAKTEVRFVNERAVFAAVERACWAALSGATLATPESGAWQRPIISHAQKRANLASGAPDTLGNGADSRHSQAELILEDASPSGDEEARTPAWADATEEFSLRDLAPLRAVGQVGRQWLIAESPGGMVVVDPHAAHEKLLYTRIMARDTAVLGSQLLLVPATVQLSPAQMAFATSDLRLFEQWGITVEEFGPAQLRCTAVPTVATRADAEKLVVDLIDQLASETDEHRRKHAAAALMACHSAVRLGDTLGPEEQQRLLDELVTVPRATTCPHGRPTVFVLDDRTLRRTFGRPV